MPTFEFTSPDGKKYSVDGPQGATKEQAFEILQAQISGDKAAPAAAEPKPAAKSRSWPEVPGEALRNLPASAGNFLTGIGQAIAHPIETISGMVDVVGGGLINAAPRSVSDALNKLDRHPERTARAVSAADAAGSFYKDRYGSGEGFKNALATDPVGVASDVSAVLTGGAAAAGKAGMAGASNALRTAGKVANPLTAPTAVAGAVARKVAPAAGNGLANIIGGVGTFTGAETIKQAYRSGKQGGQSATDFADNMRGNVPITDVLDKAKANIEAMGREKSQAYRQGMAQVTSDRSVLNFNGIDQAVTDAGQAVSFKGQAKNQRAAAVQKAIADEVDAWKALDPAEYHTPEGLDALKQRIGGIVEALPFEEKTARMAGDKIYHAIKAEIVRQAPAYADAMKDYSVATEQIREIERALSLGKKASVDTAMRKLQSLTRNNVQTNYGNRLDLARQMEQQGGNALMPALAGQALSSWTPRGLGNVVAGGAGVAALNGATGALPFMAMQSPRLMGEASFAAGKGARSAGGGATAVRNALMRTGLTPAELANYMSIAGREPVQP